MVWLCVGTADRQVIGPDDIVYDVAWGAMLPALRESLNRLCAGLDILDVSVTDECYNHRLFVYVWDAVVEHCGSVAYLGE